MFILQMSQVLDTYFFLFLAENFEYLKHDFDVVFFIEMCLNGRKTNTSYSSHRYFRYLFDYHSFYLSESCLTDNDSLTYFF